MGSYRLGEEVLAPWASDGFLYPAVLVEISDTSAHVAYLDGDESDVPTASLRAGCIGPGLPIQANWKGKGRYYNAVVDRRLGQALFLNYADGDRGWATIAQHTGAAETRRRKMTTGLHTLRGLDRVEWARHDRLLSTSNAFCLSD